MNGWGVRPWNWEFSAGVQHELMPRISTSLGWFRRIYGNFNVVDNEALGPRDYTEYAVVLPSTDPRLPGAGTTLGGFFDPASNPPARGCRGSSSSSPSCAR